MLLVSLCRNWGFLRKRQLRCGYGILVDRPSLSLNSGVLTCSQVTNDPKKQALGKRALEGKVSEMQALFCRNPNPNEATQRSIWRKKPFMRGNHLCPQFWPYRNLGSTLAILAVPLSCVKAFVLEELFPAWSLSFYAKWTWIKAEPWERGWAWQPVSCWNAHSLWMTNDDNLNDSLSWWINDESYAFLACFVLAQ